jgi:hypothetical protein
MKDTHSCFALANRLNTGFAKRLDNERHALVLRTRQQVKHGLRKEGSQRCSQGAYLTCMQVKDVR